eukprot:gene24391-40227_t
MPRAARRKLTAHALIQHDDARIVHGVRGGGAARSSPPSCPSPFGGSDQRRGHTGGPVGVTSSLRDLLYQLHMERFDGAMAAAGLRGTAAGRTTRGGDRGRGILASLRHLSRGAAAGGGAPRADDDDASGGCHLEGGEQTRLAEAPRGVDLRVVGWRGEEGRGEWRGANGTGNFLKMWARVPLQAREAARAAAADPLAAMLFVDGGDVVVTAPSAAIVAARFAAWRAARRRRVLFSADTAAWFRTLPRAGEEHPAFSWRTELYPYPNSGMWLAVARDAACPGLDRYMRSRWASARPPEDQAFAQTLRGRTDAAVGVYELRNAATNTTPVVWHANGPKAFYPGSGRPLLQSAAWARWLRPLPCPPPRGKPKCGKRSLAAYRRNVVRLLGTCKADFRHVFVYPLMGPTLAARLHEGNKASPPVLARLAKELAIAVDLLHFDCKLCHTDIKPENILVKPDADGSVVGIGSHWCLCDLGSSSFYDGSPDRDLVCTRQYRPPEVVLSQPWGYAVDSWSLGCVLHEARAGSHLFDAQSPSTQWALFERRQQRFRGQSSSLPHPPPVPFAEVTLAACRGDPLLLQLLQQLLAWDPPLRLRADE